MSKIWKIWHKGASEETDKPVAEVHELEYHGEWMADCFVTATVTSPEPIDWHFDDYIVYRGETFSINYDPNVVKKARRGTYGEGFTYENVKLYFLGNKTRSYGFKDVVLFDNNITYTSLSTFQFFCASIDDFADRLQANFNREQQSSLISGNPFKVLTPSFTRTKQRYPSITENEWLQYFDNPDSGSSIHIEGETDINISIDRQNCFDVMKHAYESFGLAYYFKGTDIIIGGKAVHLNTGSQNIFRYGKGLGLYEIERTSDDQQELVTKLFAYGSEQNLPLNYYANIGKKVKATIAFKSVHTSIVSHPTLSLWIDTTSAKQFMEAFSPNYRATLTHGNDSATFIVGASDWIARDNEPAIELDYPWVHLYWIMYGEQQVQTFFNNIHVGDEVFVTGCNINAVPSEFIYIPQDYDYSSALSINKLMLPGFPRTPLNDWVAANHPELLSRYDFSTDKKDPWIKSKHVSDIGLFEGTANYDGSEQTEIYPTIENTDSCQIAFADEVMDNGYLEEGSNIKFHLYMYRGNRYLDWGEVYENALDRSSISIEMKSGFCTGRSFKVVEKPKSSTKDNVDVWDITCERFKDTSLERYFPYFDNDTSHYCQVLSGDTFVVTGIQMPDEYIEAAAEKLLIAACGYLDKRDHMRYTYLPKIDEIFMQRDADERGALSYHDTIFAGMMMEFEDTDLGIWHSPFIDNLTIKENGNNGIPTYDVVLRDEKEKGALEKLTDKIIDLMENPPVQVVERQQKVLQYVEYPEWISGNPYYFETLNTETDVLETSMVWHYGNLWQCLRTLTQGEPAFSDDWQLVRGEGWRIDFELPKGILVPLANVDVIVPAMIIMGDADLTEKVVGSGMVLSVAWTRDSGSQASDLMWRPTTEDVTVDGHSAPLKLHIRHNRNTEYADCGPEWETRMRCTFICTVNIGTGVSLTGEFGLG